MKKPEKDIIRGFLDGNAGDYTTISHWVREVVLRMLNFNPFLQDDAVSDTICELLSVLKAGEFRGEAMLKTYIQQIARYKCIDVLRSRKRARLCAERAKAESPQTDDPADPFSDEEEYYLLDRLVSLTDPRCLELWKMICLEGMSYKEIARTIGLTEGAVKTRVSRCRERALELRQAMEKKI